MNLLYVHESFGSLGGAEANVIITAAEMKARGHTVGLWTRRATGRGEERWREVFGDRIHWLDREELLAVRTARSPDVVYVHKWDDLPSLEALTTSGLPLIRMVHDHDIYCLRSYRYHPLTRKVCHRPASLYCVFPCLATLKRNRGGGFPFTWVSYFDKLRELELNRRFHRHLVVTRYMQHELELNHFAPDHIEIFPPVPRPVESLRSNFSERNLLLYVGQLIRGKGVDVLLRALAKVTLPFEAVILGDGNHKAECERLAVELGLSDRVTFAGFIPQEQLKNYYREASAVLISSLWPEPIATVGLEVMRFALPVIAFDAGGISDWLHDGETGYLVPWKDEEAYARRIEDLLKDKARAKAMGERGLEIVTRDYDFGRYLERLEDLFSRVSREVASQTGAPKP
jgi:glycosyltransferase involved in cell wall biosynthesis